MWIRSQDNAVLMQVEILEISETYKQKYNIECHGYVLGHYSTKDKALKVLDMIQKFLDNEFLMRVFQMPQDDEVEV